MLYQNVVVFLLLAFWGGDFLLKMFAINEECEQISNTLQSKKKKIFKGKLQNDYIALHYSNKNETKKHLAAIYYSFFAILFSFSLVTTQRFCNQKSVLNTLKAKRCWCSAHIILFSCVLLIWLRG